MGQTQCLEFVRDHEEDLVRVVAGRFDERSDEFFEQELYVEETCGKVS